MGSDVVSIKGTRNGLVIHLSSGFGFEEIKNNLKKKMETQPGFFKGARFVLRSEGFSLSPAMAGELESICSEYGLIPGIDRAVPARPEHPVLETAAAALPVQNPDFSRQPVSHNGLGIQPDATPKLLHMPSIGISEKDSTPCLMINRNIRSGQKIHYGGHVIVDGDVNPGSEISAAGDIIVMGSLRGMAHAGASGQSKAVIVAYRMNPVQLRIASSVGRAPDNNQSSSYPEIAYLQRDGIVIEPYLTFGLRKAKAIEKS